MTPTRVVARLAALGLVGWFVVTNGMVALALLILVFVLVAQRTVLDRRWEATPAELWVAAGCLVVALPEVDPETVEMVRGSRGAMIAMAAFAGGVGVGVFTARRARGAAGVRYVGMVTCLIASISVQGAAHHSGARLRWWPVWLVVFAALLQLRRQAAVDERRRGRGRWRQRAVAAAIIVGLVLFLVGPVTDAVDYLPRIDRQTRADGDPDPNAEPYWGFDDRLDTSVRGDLSDEEVLRVRSDIPAFWRVTTFDVWDGRVWTRSDLAARSVMPTGAPWRLLDQRVEIRQPFGPFVAGAPLITDVSGGDFFVGPDGMWQAGGVIGPGTTYDVTSVMAMPDRELLRSLDPSRATPAAIESFQGPLPTTDRVRALARETSAGSTNDYDRIQALIGWIADNVEYDRDSPVPPAGADAVDEFLFEDRVGFCEQIASSLAVMARELGIPARLAAGFVPGEHTGNRTWISRGRDAHAWVEVFFPEVGWVAFDPTAEVPLAGEYDGGPDWLGLLMRIGLVVVVLAVGVGVWLLLRRRRSATSEAAELTSWIDRFSAIRGRQPSETLREYGDRLAADLGDQRPPQVAWLLERASYAVPAEHFDAHDVATSVTELEVAAIVGDLDG